MLFGQGWVDWCQQSTTAAASKLIKDAVLALKKSTTQGFYVLSGTHILSEANKEITVFK